MKAVCIVSGSAATCFGGAETFVLNAARVLSGECEVHIVSGKGEPTGDMKRLLASSGVVLHALRYISRNSAFSRRLIRGWLRTKVNEFDVEALSLLMLPGAIKKVMERSDVIAVNYATESLIFPLLGNGARKIIHFHGPWLSPIYAHLKGRINKSVDVMVTCSAWSKGELEKRLGAKPGVEVIYNGVDTEVFHPADRSKVAFEEPYDRRLPRVGTVGRLGPAKGTDLLMEAARGMQGKAEFFAAGPIDASFAKEMERRGRPSNFHLLGPVPNHTLPAFYGAIDCFVLPSLFENFSITILEAMASGKAVIASRTGGIPEAVEDGRQGVLVPPGDGAALRDAIYSMIGNPNLMSEMGASGRERVTGNFSLKHVGRRIKELYLGAA
jgi:glycosyltransferase involved in cell wall biosynthesis